MEWMWGDGAKHRTIQLRLLLQAGSGKRFYLFAPVLTITLK
jgi:hypothetical protein